MLKDLRNSIDFFIRNKTKFSRKNFVETNEELLIRNEKENLYTKDILEQCFDKNKKEKLSILDIGSKNWFYAKGEHEFFESFCSNFSLDGIEIDAYRLYSNLYTRYETAKFYTRNLKNTNYIVGNLLDLQNHYDYIIWFLPFVVKDPHLAWGLPKKYFYPQKLLKHAYNLLKENGEMLIINQGELESQEQEKLLTNLQIPFEFKGEIQSKFFEYKNKRFAYKIKK